MGDFVALLCCVVLEGLLLLRFFISILDGARLRLFVLLLLLFFDGLLLLGDLFSVICFSVTILLAMVLGLAFLGFLAGICLTEICSKKPLTLALMVPPLGSLKLSVVVPLLVRGSARGKIDWADCSQEPHACRN